MCVTGADGLSLDLLENVEACLFDANANQQPRSLSGLHVYMEADVPRVSVNGVMRGIVWFQNETDAPLEVMLDRTLPLDQLMGFWVGDSEGKRLDPPEHPKAEPCEPLPIKSRVLRFRIGRGERVGKSFEWRPRLHVWGATVLDTCGLAKPAETGESIAGGVYLLHVVPPFAANDGSGARVSPLEILVRGESEGEATQPLHDWLERLAAANGDATTCGIDVAGHAREVLYESHARDARADGGQPLPRESFEVGSDRALPSTFEDLDGDGIDELMVTDGYSHGVLAGLHALYLSNHGCPRFAGTLLAAEPEALGSRTKGLRDLEGRHASGCAGWIFARDLYKWNGSRYAIADHASCDLCAAANGQEEQVPVSTNLHPYCRQQLRKLRELHDGKE